MNVPIRAITRGPAYHWFGYYDKLQVDSSNRYALGMEVDFQHRRPSPNDTITIGMIDLHDNDRWIELGHSNAWCWQSGCMLQWRPGRNNEIMWNDRHGDSFVSHIRNVHTGQRRTLPFAFFCVHPDGNTALGLDYERLEHMRPGYGYAGVADRNDHILAPDDAGIYMLDIESGEKRLIISLAHLARIPDETRDFAGCKHYCNCLLYNPVGSRFVFLHRWRTDGGKGWPFKTRMLSAAADGTDIRVVVPGGCGHFNWRDERHLIVQDGGFSIYKDGLGKMSQVGKGIIPDSGGHISYIPGHKWLVGDTYPDHERLQHLYVYNLAACKYIHLSSFRSPVDYAGSKDGTCDDEWRCDLHPRVSADGTLIIIDSPHGPAGRQMYMLDISRIIS